ncbi:MAG: FN3 associated domain-containing protein [Lacibacter sp.]
MQRWKAIIFNVSILLNCLLLFLLLFENRLTIPSWLQVTGRMHPLILHFPLVLIIVYAFAVIILPPHKTKDEVVYKNAVSLLLLIAAFTAVVTSLMGLFLSREEGYDSEALWWHKWGGVAIALFTLGWYAFHKQVQSRKIITIFSSLFALVLIIFTGHIGAGITHGEDFLMAPMMKPKVAAPVLLADAEVYTHMVKPILEAKCISCHNTKKAKGELIMETEELLLKGGKNGKLWDTTEADLGLFLRRLHLPMEQKEHMPPKGKPQLTDDEIAILSYWIRKGSDFKLRVADLPVDDTLQMIAAKQFSSTNTVAYDFAEADPAVITKLNSINRVVSVEAEGSPALSVNFFNSSLFQSEQLKELKKIKKQIVSLDLAKMPVQDGDLKLIGELENLRRLNLSFTNITGSGLTELKKLKFLHSISLSGTKITAAQLEQLRSFPALQTVYVWNTTIAVNELERLQQKLKAIDLVTGFKDDTSILKLTTPVLLNEEAFITEASVPLKLKHYIQGAVIRYTTDGTEPDSIRSPVFKGNETVDSNTMIRAKAYKPGWMSSDILEAFFYKSTFTPDTVVYLKPPNVKYNDEHGKMLFDRQKAETNFQLGNWVAFRENRMECLLPFSKPVTIQSITLSSLVDINSYIMPPQQIEVWGGDDAQRMKLLGRMSPEQPGKLMPVFMKGFECKFAATTIKYIKLIATPVAKLPSWHPGKGDKGWIFVDEVLLN